MQALLEGDSPALRALADGNAGAAVASALGQLLGARHIRQASLFNMLTAVMALHAKDAGGTLTIKVPPKATDVLEAEWTSAVAS